MLVSILRVVVLAAGGAARAFVTELALAGAGDILVVHRSASRGAQLVDNLASKTRVRSLHALGD